MVRILALIALASCGAVDRLDGHIDDVRNCCAAGNADDVRACMVGFEAPRWCWEAECTAPIGPVEAYQLETGEILKSCPIE